MTIYNRLWAIWFIATGAPLGGMIGLLCIVMLAYPPDGGAVTWTAAILSIWLFAGLLALADRYACPSCGTSIFRTPRFSLSFGILFDFLPPPATCRECGYSFRLEREQ